MTSGFSSFANTLITSASLRVHVLERRVGNYEILFMKHAHNEEKERKAVTKDILPLISSGLYFQE